MATQSVTDRAVPLWWRFGVPLLPSPGVVGAAIAGIDPLLFFLVVTQVATAVFPLPLWALNVRVARFIAGDGDGRAVMNQLAWPSDSEREEDDDS